MLRQSPNNSKSNNKNINPSPSKNKFVKNTQNALRSSFRNFPFRRTQTTVDTFAVEQYQSKNYQKSTTTTTTASSVPSSTSLENLNSIQPLYAPPAIRMTPPFKSPIQYPGIQLTNTPKLTNSNHYSSSSNSSSKQQNNSNSPILSPNSKLRKSLKKFHRKLKNNTTEVQTPVQVSHKNFQNDAIGARLARTHTGSQLTSQQQRKLTTRAIPPILPPTLQISETANNTRATNILPPPNLTQQNPIFVDIPKTRNNDNNQEAQVPNQLLLKTGQNVLTPPGIPMSNYSNLISSGVSPRTNGAFELFSRFKKEIESTYNEFWKIIIKLSKFESFFFKPSKLLFSIFTLKKS